MKRRLGLIVASGCILALAAMGLVSCEADDAGSAGAGGTGGTGGTGGDGGTGGTGGEGGTGGDGAPACSTEIEPCGGELLGTWTLVSQCGEMYQLMDAASVSACKRLDVRIAWDRWEATSTYEADGSFHGTYDVERSFTMEVPARCLEALNATDLDAACASAGESGLGRYFDDGECSRDQDGICTCIYRHAAAGTEGGNWSTAGEILYQDPFVVGMPYCVDGDHYVRHAADPGTGAALGWVYRRAE